jgi:hypothetical protein
MERDGSSEMTGDRPHPGRRLLTPPDQPTLSPQRSVVSNYAVRAPQIVLRLRNSGIAPIAMPPMPTMLVTASNVGML